MRGQSFANVTPWNVLFYEINIFLFGDKIPLHYAHLILLTSIAACCIYLLSRKFLDKKYALATAIIFLLGKPTIHIAQGLMHGHYITGLILSTLSLYTYIKFFEERKRGWIAASALLYLLSTACKEVYVPLPLILLALPISRLADRVKAAIFHFLSLIIYAGWRKHALGGFIGGYKPLNESLDAQMFYEQFSRIPHLLVTDPVELSVLALTMAFGVWKAAGQNIKNLNFILALALCVTLPLIPLLKHPGITQADRYLFVPWVALSALSGLSLSNIRLPAIRLSAAILILFIFFNENKIEYRKLEPIFSYWDSTYNFSVNSDSRKQGLFLGEKSPDSEYRLMVFSSARQAMEKTRSTSSEKLFILADQGWGLAPRETIASGAISYFHHKDGKMQEVEAEAILEVQEKFLKRLEKGAGEELSIEMHYKNRIIDWKISNTKDRIIGSSKKYYRGEMPPEGNVKMPNDDKSIEFSFCVESSDKISCSPKLDFTFSNHDFRWTGLSTKEAPSVN